jgi:histidyl-tRNA synthetase
MIMKKIIQPLKGTRDFYPEIMAMRNWLYNTLREVSESFGYQEYEGPFLEPVDLYAAKSGDELVKEQSFVFPDRGGDLITLRPELTPTLVRMIAQRQSQLVFPLRWWSWGPMWRYERPQKGRTREFFQWNADLVGMNSPEADAELVALIATFFKKTGLASRQVAVLVNNRRLMDLELACLEIPKDLRPGVSRFIDRKDKMKLEEWLAYGAELGLKTNQLDGLQSILANKDLWQKSDELVRFFKAVEALGVSEYVRFDSSIIRGLDYYTGTVFEAKEIEGDIRRSILGGGRYDNLMADVGGDSIPGVGFAMGDVVITLILEKAGVLPKGNDQASQTVLITVFNEDTLLASYGLAAELRRVGVKTACYPEPAKLTKQFKFADRTGIRLVVALGPDEIANGAVTIKNMASGAQETVPRVDAKETIRKLLDCRPSS